jgi:glycosyltransferase involved in cell wall biosynthesis
LVKTRDVKEMANAIVELLNDDEKRKSMGAYSRKIIQENYTYEILAEKWRSVIRGLVNINNKTELN